jgi:hypothetical protein
MSCGNIKRRHGKGETRRGRLSALRGAAAIGGVACVLMASCAQSTGSSTAHRVNGDGNAVTASTEQVLLLPRAEGGDGGWCLATVVGECHAASALRGPIIVEDWHGQGPPPVNIGVALTTSEVAGLTVGKGPTIPTRRESALPDTLRAAVIDVYGPGVPEPGFNITGPPPPPRFIPVNARGVPLAQTNAPRAPIWFTVPTRRWRTPTTTPRGVCQIRTTRLAGLVETEGAIATRLIAPREPIARPLLSCISISYRLGRWSLIAGLLIDASHPGSTPSRLPALSPIPHSSAVQALDSQGGIVARRVPGAWLIVGNGKGLQQRLTLLEHLRATVHL